MFVAGQYHWIWTKNSIINLKTHAIGLKFWDEKLGISTRLSSKFQPPNSSGSSKIRLRLSFWLSFYNIAQKSCFWLIKTKWFRHDPESIACCKFEKIQLTYRLWISEIFSPLQFIPVPKIIASKSCILIIFYIWLFGDWTLNITCPKIEKILRFSKTSLRFEIYISRTFQKCLHDFEWWLKNPISEFVLTAQKLPYAL